MSATSQFATDVVQRMPNPELYKGEFIDLLIELLPVILPLIISCFEDDNNPEATFGTQCQQLAGQAQHSIIKRIRFRLLLRKELGWQDFKSLDGRELSDAMVNQAAASEPAVLDQVYAECC